MVTLDELYGKRLYLDANVFIYALEQLDPWYKVAQALLVAIDKGKAHSITSELTLTECLIKPVRENQPESALAFEQVIESRDFFEVLPVSRRVLIETARLRSTTALKLPDAIHAATAVVGSL